MCVIIQTEAKTSLGGGGGGRERQVSILYEYTLLHDQKTHMPCALLLLCLSGGAKLLVRGHIINFDGIQLQDNKMQKRKEKN